MRNERTSSEADLPSLQKPQPEAYSQSSLSSELKATLSLKPLSELLEGAPPGRTSLCERLSPQPLFFWFAVYLLKHLQLPGAEGLPVAGSGPRSRFVFIFCLSVSALASHNPAPLFVHREACVSLPPAGRGNTQAVRVQESVLKPLACIPACAAPRLSFLCKPEQGRAD